MIIFLILLAFAAPHASAAPDAILEQQSFLGFQDFVNVRIAAGKPCAGASLVADASAIRSPEASARALLDLRGRGFLDKWKACQRLEASLRLDKAAYEPVKSGRESLESFKTRAFERIRRETVALGALYENDRRENASYRYDSPWKENYLYESLVRRYQEKFWEPIALARGSARPPATARTKTPAATKDRPNPSIDFDGGRSRPSTAAPRPGDDFYARARAVEGTLYLSELEALVSALERTPRRGEDRGSQIRRLADVLGSSPALTAALSPRDGDYSRAARLILRFGVLQAACRRGGGDCGTRLDYRLAALLEKTVSVSLGSKANAVSIPDSDAGKIALIAVLSRAPGLERTAAWASRENLRLLRANALAASGVPFTEAKYMGARGLWSQSVENGTTVRTFQAHDGTVAARHTAGVQELWMRNGSLYQRTVSGRLAVQWSRTDCKGRPCLSGLFNGRYFEAAPNDILLVSPDGSRLEIVDGSRLAAELKRTTPAKAFQRVGLKMVVNAQGDVQDLRGGPAVVISPNEPPEGQLGRAAKYAVIDPENVPAFKDAAAIPGEAFAGAGRKVLPSFVAMLARDGVMRGKSPMVTLRDNKVRFLAADGTDLIVTRLTGNSAEGYLFRSGGVTECRWSFDGKRWRMVNAAGETEPPGAWGTAVETGRLSLETVGSIVGGLMSPVQTVYYEAASGVQVVLAGPASLLSEDLGCLQVVSAYYTLLQTQANQFRERSLTPEKRALGHYAAALKLNPRCAPKLVEFGDYLVGKERKSSQDSAQNARRAFDKSISDADRAYAFEGFFGMGNLPKGIFMAGKDKLVAGRGWEGVIEYFAAAELSGLMIYGEMTAQGQLFGALYAKPKLLAAKGLSRASGGTRSVEQAEATLMKLELAAMGAPGLIHVGEGLVELSMAQWNGTVVDSEKAFAFFSEAVGTAGLLDGLSEAGRAKAREQARRMNAWNASERGWTPPSFESGPTARVEAPARPGSALPKPQASAIELPSYPKARTTVGAPEAARNPSRAAPEIEAARPRAPEPEPVPPPKPKLAPDEERLSDDLAPKIAAWRAQGGRSAQFAERLLREKAGSDPEKLALWEEKIGRSESKFSSALSPEARAGFLEQRLDLLEENARARGATTLEELTRLAVKLNLPSPEKHAALLLERWGRAAAEPPAQEPPVLTGVAEEPVKDRALPAVPAPAPPGRPMPSTALFAGLSKSESHFSRLGDERATILVLEAERYMSSVVERNGGTVVQTRSGVLHARFADPVAAVKTAVELQRGRDALREAAGEPVSLGVSIDTGLVLPSRDSLGRSYFYGESVNRAANNRAAADGGVVLTDSVSSDPRVRALVEGWAPTSVAAPGKEGGAPLIRFEPVPEKTPSRSRPAAPALGPPEKMAVLFTDLEGSTAFYKRDPLRAAESVNLVESFTREIAEKNGGRIIKTTGDGAMFVFKKPADAMSTALEIRRRLAEFQTLAGEPLSIKSSVDTGVLYRVADGRGGIDYVGRAALGAESGLSLSGGGRIALGESTRRLAQSDPALARRLAESPDALVEAARLAAPERPEMSQTRLPGPAAEASGRFRASRKSSYGELRAIGPERAASLEKAAGVDREYMKEVLELGCQSMEGTCARYSLAALFRGRATLEQVKAASAEVLREPLEKEKSLLNAKRRARWDRMRELENSGRHDLAGILKDDIRKNEDAALKRVNDRLDNLASIPEYEGLTREHQLAVLERLGLRGRSLDPDGSARKAYEDALNGGDELEFLRRSAGVRERVEAELKAGRPVLASIGIGGGEHAVSVLRAGLDEGGRKVVVLFDSASGGLFSVPWSRFEPYGALSLEPSPIFLDSGILISYDKGAPGAEARFNKLIAQGYQPKMSAQVVIEMLEGEQVVKTEKFLEDLRSSGRLTLESPSELSRRQLEDAGKLAAIWAKLGIGSKPGKTGRRGGDAAVLAGAMVRSGKKPATIATTDKKFHNLFDSLVKGRALAESMKKEGLADYPIPTVLLLP